MMRERMTIIVVNTDIVPGQPDGGSGGGMTGIGDPVGSPS